MHITINDPDMAGRTVDGLPEDPRDRLRVAILVTAALTAETGTALAAVIAAGRGAFPLSERVLTHQRYGTSLILSAMREIEAFGGSPDGSG